MIGRLNHVAIAVPDLAAASAQYRDMLGAKVGAPQDEPDHGVTVVFIDLPNTRIELLYPLGDNSPIAGFLEKNPSGGIHHICFEVEDILAARDRLRAQGARVLGSGEPKIGAHGKPVLFLHPKVRTVSQDDVGEVVPGTPRGAPATETVGRSAWITTMIATVIWAMVAGIIVSGVITLKDIDVFHRLDFHKLD